MLEIQFPLGEGRRCLVLGGRGFIGSHLVAALLNRGFRVRCFERPHVKPIGESFLDNPNFELYEGDFTSEADVAEALSECDFCYHLVSTTLPKSSNSDPIFDVESNVVGTIRLLNHATKNHLQKIIFVSSGGTVYGPPVEVPISENHPTNPVCSYGITKLAIEKYFSLFHDLYNLDYAVLRLANPFGEGQRTLASQGAVAVFLGKVLRGEPIEIWGDGSVVRDYIHVSDVVDALLLSIAPSNGSHVFNIGSGCGHSLNEVLATIEEVARRRATMRYSEARAFDVPVNVLDISKAQYSLGWSPQISFFAGIDRFARWLGENNEFLKS
ncbi:NAD-dependent epimerase/dehydratase family protein [Variovorax paradoxus]|uniref:NAD-dependent epimerase/dehydratase family protein n=1 Tax=Variovorax paradoxus TaxID=34073 RepID=UPI00278593AE|nr:NAD-dependent epimerase/dehydratase family protein [Variovorax paradoxus]MDQ0589037.1 UDP-glucose 4-epimerase [Variovorax paradoxus]